MPEEIHENNIKKTGVGKKFFFSVIIFLFFIILLEGSLRVANYFLMWQETTYTSTSVYAKTDWIEDYYKEMESIETEYYPYTGWKMKEMNGNFIKINSSGERYGWNPKFSGKTKKIFVFGGSTVFGKGARDEYTIPSYLSKILNEKTAKYEVKNKGVYAYVFTQDIINLILALKAGEKPDYVIFYNGINDVFAAFQNGTAGYVSNMAIIKDRLKSPKASNNFRMIWEGLSKIVQNNCEIYRTAWKIKNTIFGKKLHNEAAFGYSGQDMEKISAEITLDYRDNVKLIDDLSRVYGFKYLVFWQPVMYVFTETTEEEQTLMRPDEMAKKFFEKTYGLMLKEKMKNFYNVSKIFENKNETVFLDFAHLAENGNEMVAKEIYKYFLKIK